jgi:hypothetical protein
MPQFVRRFARVNGRSYAFATVVGRILRPRIRFV